MTFLQIRPYVRLGGTLNVSVKTDAGSFKKGTKVTQSVYDTVQSSSLITLNVIDTPKVTREFKKTRVKTYNTVGDSSFIYYSSGDAGYSFKVKCLIRKKDTLKDGKTVFKYLNYFYSHHITTSIVINTETVPNGVYYISDFTEYEPIRKDYYHIEIEFSKSTPVSSKLTNKCTVLQSHLKQCKRFDDTVYTVKQIDAAKKGKPLTVKYTEKDKKTGKKVTKTKTIKPLASPCIGKVNEVLYTLGYYSPTDSQLKKSTLLKKANSIVKKITGKKLTSRENTKKFYKNYQNYWTKTSRKGLKKFQKKWNKKKLSPKLKEKGRLDKNTWKAILRYPELKGK